MIFATVGSIPFHRLVQAVDNYAASSEHEVIIQSASKSFKSKNCKHQSYYANINKVMQTADIIISHAGVGTIYKILQLKKPAVIIPRRHALGEHFDDHQWELSEHLKDSLPFVFLDNIDDLGKAIESCQNLYSTKGYKSTRTDFFNSLKKEIELLINK